MRSIQYFFVLIFLLGLGKNVNAQKKNVYFQISTEDSINLTKNNIDIYNVDYEKELDIYNSKLDEWKKSRKKIKDLFITSAKKPIPPTQYFNFKIVEIHDLPSNQFKLSEKKTIPTIISSYNHDVFFIQGNAMYQVKYWINPIE